MCLCPCLCSCVCVHVCACASVNEGLCMSWSCVEVSEWLSGVSSCLLASSEGFSCFYAGTYSGSADLWASNHSPVSFPCHHWSAGIKDEHHSIWYFMCILGIELKSSGLCGKWSTELSLWLCLFIFIWASVISFLSLLHHSGLSIIQNVGDGSGQHCLI